MNQRLQDGLRLLGIAPEMGTDPSAAAQAMERKLGIKLPASALELLRFPGLMPAIARGIEGHTEFPDQAKLGDGSYLPDVREPVLVLLYENQGVVVWALPLKRGDDPPVLVGYQTGDRLPSVEYAPTLAEFVFAMAWDGQETEQARLLMAQATTLDPSTLQQLRTRYREIIETRGWPADNQYRFEGENGFRITLWSGDRQCDWWVTADDRATLEREARWLIELSNLRTSFWSNEPECEELLTRLRA